MPMDLAILASCQNCKATAEGVISQHRKLGIRPITPSLFVHPAHDPGCVQDAPSILRSQQSLYRYAIVICDHEGSGRESSSAVDLEEQIEESLAQAGWRGRVAAIVIDPELEAWVWSDSPHVAEVLGWQQPAPALRAWMEEQGFLLPGEAKPRRPKEATEAVMELSRKRRTSAIFGRLAGLVSFQRCTDRAFLKFCRTLQSWFADNPRENDGAPK